MNWFRNLLGNEPSLVLCYDRVTPSDFEVIEEQIADLQKSYTLVTLTELIMALNKERARGLAALAFELPRRGLQDWVATHPIPMTIFLDPDCIGTNRLPLREEILRLEHGNELANLAIEAPDKALEELTRKKKESGPLAYNEMSPFDFMMTWGKLIEMPKERVSFGLYLGKSDRNTLQRDLGFAETQLQQKIEVALSTINGGADVAKGLGLGGCVTKCQGLVTQKTDPFQIPIYNVEK